MYMLYEGNYRCVSQIGFENYLLKLGIEKSQIPSMIQNARVEVLGPAHPKNSFPGKWCITESFGNYVVSFSFLKDEKQIIKDNFGNLKCSINRFKFKEPYRLIQYKAASRSLIVGINRFFADKGLVMHLQDLVSKTQAKLLFVREDHCEKNIYPEIS